MIPPSEYLRSVEPIAALWLVCVALLVPLTVAGYRRWRRRPLRHLVTGEAGAAYSMAYVMTFPLYVWLVALVIESSLLLIDKFGTVSAAYAAARSAVVWRPQNEVLARTKAHAAAVNAMAPFASSNDLHADGVRPSQRGAARKYAAEAGRFVKLPGASSDYVPAKYLYADKATSVRVTKIDPRPGGLVRVELTYLAPTYVPGIGKFFGTKSPKGGNYYVVEIRTTVELPDEAPRSADGKLGINHVTPP